MALEDIKGVGAVRRQILNSLGMESVGDVLGRFPKNYLQADSECGELRDGEVAALFGTFESSPRRAFSKKGARFATAVFVSGGKKLNAVWFRADYIVHAVKPDAPYLVTGRIKLEGRKVSLIQPICDSDVSEEIIPIYRLSNKLSQKVFRKIVHSALTRFPAESMIPEVLRRAHGLSELSDSYENLHVPTRLLRRAQAVDRTPEISDVDWESECGSAKRRIDLEQFYALLMSFRVTRTFQSEREHRYASDSARLREFISRFPFELTLSQQKAVNEIYSDLSGSYPMNRLLQGDVGSGKTAVAACALFLAVSSGFQCAVAAPTEVLARQHFEGFSELFAGICEVVLLTSSVTGKARQSVLGKIEDGRAKVIVGTHSILQNTVKYRNLSLAVIDEQHKFGVTERAKLVEKGENCDVLVMSATPIPRTLSLLFYNDLDVSVLSEKPANRGKVSNYIVRKSKREDMFRYLGEKAGAGERIYVVCPCVEEEENAEAVKSLHAELSKLLPGLSLGLLYGGMKESEKSAVISAFKDGSVSILVSTTVIEVGVNVPSANYMAIMNADRFGLAQLHQLRGRIGRSSADGSCYFYTETESAGAMERLEFLKGTNDGFEISEQDFKLRGPGDYFGSSQSGFDKTLVNMDLGLYEEAKTLVSETELNGEFLEKYRRIGREKNLEFPAVVLN